MANIDTKRQFGIACGIIDAQYDSSINICTAQNVLCIKDLNEWDTTNLKT